MLRHVVDESVESDVCESKRIRNLYAAVMGRAIHDLEVSKGGDSQSALDWFLGREAPIPFRDCCAVLELDEESVLLALRGRGLLPLEIPLKLAG